MALRHMTGLTPHLQETDLELLEGHIVLGEPLALLMSAALRMRLVSVRRGLSTFEFTLPAEEGDALQRAMARVDAPSALFEGAQDAHRLTVVLVQACLAADAVVRSVLARPA